MPNYKTLYTEPAHSGIILWLNQPENHNAISTKMIDELIHFFTQPAKKTAFIIMAGKGDCFAAGADLKEMMKLSEHQALQTSHNLHKLITHIAHYQAPVIAAVHGYAIGGGFELALGADMIFAAKDTFFAMPEINFALIPGAGGTQTLTQQLGRADAYYHILTANKLSAHYCQQKGIVQQIFDNKNFFETITNRANQLTSKIDHKAAMALKKTIRHAHENNAYATESEEFAWLLSHKAKPHIKKFIYKSKEK